MIGTSYKKQTSEEQRSDDKSRQEKGGKVKRRRWQAAELAEKVGRSEAEQLEVTTRAVRGTGTDRGNKS